MNGNNPRLVPESLSLEFVLETPGRLNECIFTLKVLALSDSQV